MSTNSVLSGIANQLLPHKIAPSLPLDFSYKPIVICLYKKLEESHLELLRDYGKVIELSTIYVNIDSTELDFDYLIVDLREDYHRTYFQRFIRNKDYYHLVLYKHTYETNNGISFHNELNVFPTRQAFQQDFNMLLLSDPVPEPKWYVAFFRSCVFGSAQINA